MSLLISNLAIPRDHKISLFFYESFMHKQWKGEKLKMWLSMRCIKISQEKPSFPNGTFAKSLNHCLLEALGHRWAWVEIWKGCLHRKRSQTIFFSLVSGETRMLFKIKQWPQAELTGKVFSIPSSIAAGEAKPELSVPSVGCSAPGQGTRCSRDKKSSWCHTGR